MKIEIKKLRDYVWEIPRTGDMLVPGIVYGDTESIIPLKEEVNTKHGGFTPALLQVANVATLPGIVKASLAMADIHPGYGFAIGGVAAFDMDTGVISVAGVGFDINCGVRVLKTGLERKDIEPLKELLADKLLAGVPSGVGSTGEVKLNEGEIDALLVKGSAFVLERGFGTQDDLEYTEESGAVKGADPSSVSQRAKERQFKQVGTLGSGNHYLEVQYIEEIYDDEAATAYGLHKGQALIAIHCGSRGLGHQIGTDYLKPLEAASRKYGIPIRDRELVCAPINSPEGRQYLSAVSAGINCAFANRQVISHLARKAFAAVFDIDPITIKLLYDVGHNTCKVESHDVDGVTKRLLVHRKGATRAFGPGRIECPAAYRGVGHPLLVGGTMGTASYIMRGTSLGMTETFGSTIHGAGRALSRMQAKKEWDGAAIIRELGHKGIIIKSHSKAGVAEEAPGAYKDIDKVVNIMHNAGINRKVARLRPMVCVKG
ncbi:MAG: RNA-splicing ligase RtcB [Deltaproteobacteria bacterium RIFCSPLOWO2_02_FULL_53_8]|nr:MAG: RNA-splicing ligase RtcB [Deltaproteobacteria bacterium RIFCSPLOWO2_02_FULL_53_8]